MKAAIWAGDMGTRLKEFTEVKPKPPVEIGGLPVLWHIMIKGHMAFTVDVLCTCIARR
jgi:glucose-1-phosphate cytidylyltransferase